MMELYPKRKSDEAFVEAVRKRAACSRKLGVFHACGVVFFLGAFLAFSHLIYSADGMMKDISSGVHIGIMFGFMGGLFIFWAIQNAFWATQYFKGNRTERLMLKFHDDLKGRDAEGLHKENTP